jgi:hypothetical protein
MKKLIGIVSEGPTDYLVLKAVIDKITGEENCYLSLQPEPDMLGRYGNGWKGVWRWCKEALPLNELMHGVKPHIDAIVIQMDGDVIRKEKEPHCLCTGTVCEKKNKVFPLYCELVKNGQCPVELPCKDHNDIIDDKIAYSSFILKEALQSTDMANVVITIPCDSTDAWVVAAYDEVEDIENLVEPWKNIIARKKYFHGLRVRGDKKNTKTYAAFSEVVAEQWENVTKKCRAAMIFDYDVIKNIKEVLNDPMEEN